MNATIPVANISDTNIPEANISDTYINANSYDLIAADEITTIRTTCPYCGVGCGVLASVDKTGQVSVQGDPEHPANYGKLCSKGSNLAQTLGVERRLTQPYYQNKQRPMQFRQSPRHAVPLDSEQSLKTSAASETSAATKVSGNITDNITVTDWNTVLDDVASRLNDTIAKHGRDSVMFYVSGQLLSEDYYVANKFIKGFIGNNNIDSNSRLCMSSAVAGHKRAFGADVVPGNYADFESCDLLVLVGSNMAWCHPILFGRFLKAKLANPNKKLVVIDPRRTDSCEFADLHLPIAAGTDTHLYNGLLHYLEQNGCRDADYAAKCEGLEAALMMAQPWTIAAVAEATQVDAAQIEQFYQLVADHAKTVTAFSMGVNQSSSGTDKVNAIINTHLLTGRVGIKGASPFSLTGQPNAMGGREVGALANLLAAHLDLADSGHRDLVADFWQTPQAIAPNVGVKACDAADAILDGRIKAIWIMATNPVVSLPEADKFRQALAECDLVIVSECSKDSDTIQCADIVLPAQGWGEKSGTVTNSERRITRQRRLLPAVGEAKPDWWILSQVAKRMGLSGFDYQHPSEIFNEHVALTNYRNSLYENSETKISTAKSNSVNSNEANTYSRHLNLANDITQQMGIATSLTYEQYDAMPPLQWGGERINVMDDDYCHSNPKMQAITPPPDAGALNVYQPTASANKGREANHATVHATANVNSEVNADVDSIPNQHPKAINNPKLHDLRLITGRLRDQWHTMTRTGLAPKLNQQQAMPVITLNPSDAKHIGVRDADFIALAPKVAFADLSSYLAHHNPAYHNPAYHSHSVMAQVEVSDAMRVGDAFMPMHWSDAFASLARVGVVIPTKVDPISAQPELKNSAITVQPVPMYSVGRILVHPDWLDTVLVQLRHLMFDSTPDTSLNRTERGEDATEADTLANPERPNIVWSLSRQEDSVLINIATPHLLMSKAWITADFWQDFVAAVALIVAGDDDKISGKTCGKSSDNPIETSVMTDAATQQLRLVISQAMPEITTTTTATAVQPVTSAVSDTAQQSSKQPSKQLKLAVYIAPTYDKLPSTHWLNSCFADLSAVPSVKWLLAGRPASGYVDPGPLVCACMGVGENIIINAITGNSCADAAAVGKLTQAGTNCGSCVGQINELIAAYA